MLDYAYSMYVYVYMCVCACPHFLGSHPEFRQATRVAPADAPASGVLSVITPMSWSTVTHLQAHTHAHTLGTHAHLLLNITWV